MPIQSTFEQVGIGIQKKIDAGTSDNVLRKMATMHGQFGDNLKDTLKEVYMRAWSKARNFLPPTVFGAIRAIGTATMTPIIFSVFSGHFRSSLHSRAMARSGKPLPWYSYPCIDFLKTRDFSQCRVLESGAGQSTLWWGQNARDVVALEDSSRWIERLSEVAPRNVALHLVTTGSPAECCKRVSSILNYEKPFDVIAMDGLYRPEVLDICTPHLADRGIVIVDDSSGYATHEVLQKHELKHVDFYGLWPGTIELRCTSIAYRNDAFVFDASNPIPCPTYDY